MLRMRHDDYQPRLKRKRCVDMIIMRIAGRLHGYRDDCWTIIITVIILVTLVI